MCGNAPLSGPASSRTAMATLRAALAVGNPGRRDRANCSRRSSRVDMGEPFLQQQTLPTTLQVGRPVAQGDSKRGGETFAVAAVGMGNPHLGHPGARPLNTLILERLGPLLEVDRPSPPPPMSISLPCGRLTTGDAGCGSGARAPPACGTEPCSAGGAAIAWAGGPEGAGWILRLDAVVAGIYQRPLFMAGPQNRV